MIVKPGKTPLSIKLPTSKSVSNRLLILGAKSENWLEIQHLSESTDVTSMLEILIKIGVEVKVISDDVIKVRGPFPACEIQGEPLELNVGDGGTTARFLVPLLAQGKRVYKIFSKERLRERPMDELYELITSHGGTILRQEGLSFPITIKGPVAWPSEINISAERSTQFASGLLLSLIKSNAHVKVANVHNSRPYWQMTEELCSKVKNGQLKFVVPIDYSSLTYPVAFASLHEGARFPQITSIDWTQADSSFLNFFKQMGGKFELGENGLHIEGGSDLQGISADCTSCPDLIPTFLFLASYVKGESVVKGINILKYKESDRLEEMLELLNLFEIKFKLNIEKDELSIYGGNPLKKEVHCHPPRDHRLVMTSYLFLKHNSGGVLENEDCVDKSFPHFFDVMENK